MKDYGQNNLARFLKTIFTEQKVAELFSRYYVGTSEVWPGSVVFWQVDTTGRVRTGKVMQYNADTGKRVKHPFNHITWVHKNEPAGARYKQCLFGEHLLSSHPQAPVAVVESEKTALIASVYFPQYVWLACGGLGFLTHERCLSLKSRSVYLFPDLKAYEKWQHQAKALQELASFQVSNILEHVATTQQKQDSLDLADFLIYCQVPNLKA
ncbi:DUF6371 domain-containing protein [Tellurirhabdus rosea]|uniref:DUF6371 domain-containing protein n=1 Tax=Tellurirhabdus rosea TaxID=2674997 RepID=UPI002250AB3A|nr:DUF6371 domain-containing protein [Tellurirhabdus rosea]